MTLSHQSLVGISTGEQPMVYKETGVVQPEQIVPASIDCTLSAHAHSMKSSALPGSNEDVSELIKGYSRYEFSFEEERRAILNKGETYLFRMEENLRLGPNFWGKFSPKSSVGRSDVFVRVLTDYYQGYDQTMVAYEGPLYLEVTSLSFHLDISPGISMTQLRVKPQGEKALSDEEISLLHSEFGLLFNKKGKVLGNNELCLDNGLYFHVDLDRKIVGFEALSNSVDHLVWEEGANNPLDFWRPIYRPKNGSIILEPGKFYLLATKERVRIPETCCGEIMPYDVNTGEFRSHYAGFFDNGFGAEGGTTGVLEVRVSEIPLRITDGQRICKMMFEKTDQVPDLLYEGHYKSSRASLSKIFKDREEIWEE